MISTLRKFPIPALALALASALALSACGGGGGSGSGGAQQITLLATPTLDGYLTLVSSTATTDNALVVGDIDTLGALRSYRSFLSFDISGLPVGAQILSATLRLSQGIVVGAPYAGGTHGVVVADHLDYGPALDAADYAGVAIMLNVGTLFSDATLGYGSVSVASRLAVDIANGSTRSQYRIRFRDADSDADGNDDYMEMEDSENTRLTGNVPQLIVTYTLP